MPNNEMTINDLAVKLDAFIVDVNKRFDAIDKRFDAVTNEIRVNAVRIDDLNNSVNWSFTTLAIIVAIVGFCITLAPMFRDMFREKRTHDNDEHTRALIRDEVDERTKIIVREELERLNVITK